MSERYLKQVIVVRKDLTMPAGKLAAMVAHAAMTFIVNRLRRATPPEELIGKVDRISFLQGAFTADEHQWMTELDPGIEETGQVSFAKIVCAVEDEAALRAVESAALTAGLQCHRVIDSGHSHNKVGAFTCIAIGPAWPEQLEPVTGGLKVYR